VKKNRNIEIPKSISLRKSKELISVCLFPPSPYVPIGIKLKIHVTESIVHTDAVPKKKEENNNKKQQQEIPLTSEG
jgi:hypothetical protein